jgi:hypothetical protein
LYPNGPRLGTHLPESSRHDATCAEAGVERAIAVEAGQREHGEGVEDGRSRQDNLPVRLQGNGTRSAKRAREIERVGHDATRSEAGVERAIGVVTRQSDVADVVDEGQPGRDNLPVRLHG